MTEERIDDLVWCDKYETVHTDSLNPEGFIEDGKQDYCKPEQHHAIYKKVHGYLNSILDASEFHPGSNEEADYVAALKVECDDYLDRKETP